MSKMLRVQVSEELHGALSSRAAQAGMSLAEYVVRELETREAHRDLPELIQRAGRLSREEFLCRLGGREAVVPTVSAAEILAEERGL